MFDLPYILTHPLLRSIAVRCAELEEQADQFQTGSAERKQLEGRIARLEEYKLPKPDSSDFQQTRPIKNQQGQIVAVAHSLRHRFKDNRRGRPSECQIQTRAALEEKLANPHRTWPQIAEWLARRQQSYYFKDVSDLKRSVRRLRALLRREGIPLPEAGACRTLE